MTLTYQPADQTGTAESTAVSLEGLTKRYGERIAVDHLSLEIPTGVVAGFIGPNGAGKTTTMAMLLGLVRPTSGGGTVLGQPLDDRASYLHEVGALIEAPAFWPGLTGVQNLEVLGTLGGYAKPDIAGVLELVGLADRGRDRYAEYSFGMKQRLGIAAALLGDPQLLILDEPTNGLDPVGINEMRQLIASLGRADRTVVVSSHILSELEQVCDWLVVIDRGALVYQGPANGFLGEADTVVVLGPERAGEVRRLADVVRGEDHSPRVEGESVIVPVGDAEPRVVAAKLNRRAADNGIVLAQVEVKRPTLESHYLAIVEGDKG